MLAHELAHIKNRDILVSTIAAAAAALVTQVAQTNPEALASALVKLERASHVIPTAATPATASLFIVNPFGAMERLSRWFSTHPATQERVTRLLAMTSSSGQRWGRHASAYAGPTSGLVREW